MKTTGKCPKCGATQSVAIPNALWNFNDIKVDMFHTTSVTRYVCTACEYLEQYVEDKKALCKLREREA